MNAGTNPDGSTSNYGWAIWHLEQAGEAQSAEAALVHATAAQARAVLAQIDDAHGNPGVGTTWSS